MVAQGLYRVTAIPVADHFPKSSIQERSFPRNIRRPTAATAQSEPPTPNNEDRF